MKKSLVVYYSLSGKTQKAVEMLKTIYDVDIERITEPQNRLTKLGYIRSVYEATMKKEPMIDRMHSDFSSYKLVIIGTPIWAGKVASPVRSFLEENKNNIQQIAMFTTSKSTSGQNAISEISSIYNGPVLSTLSLKEDEIMNKYWLKDQLTIFTKYLPKYKTDGKSIYEVKKAG